MPKFFPTKENQVRDNGYTELVLSGNGDTKKWYVDTYFGGIDKLLEDFKLVPSVNPISMGDDYNISITFKDPTKLFGIEYKTIKWFASDVMFENYFVDNLKTYEKVSYWFVKGTQTRWVNGVPVVKFNLTIDLLGTFANYIENLSGQFYFKRKHFDRWKSGNLNDKEDSPTKNVALFPNMIDAPSIKNCNDFCKNKSNKYMKSANVENDEEFTPIAIVYYDTPLSSAVKIDKFYKETVINYNGVNMSIPFGVFIVIDPNGMNLNDEVAEAGVVKINNTNLTNAINKFQSISSTPATIKSCSFSSMKTSILNQLIEEWFGMINYDEKTDGILRPPNWESTEKLKDVDIINGGGIGYIDRKFTEYDIWYVDKDRLFTKELKDLFTDKILPKNEPHLGMAVHRELHLATPDKKSQILDYSLMFLNGNPFKTDGENILIKTRWWEVFDVSYGGKYGYIDNTSTTLDASLWNDRNFIDYTGSVDFPYKTNAYLEQMITQNNQKKASYDNMNIEKNSAIGIAAVDLVQNEANTAGDALIGAGNIVSAGSSGGVFGWMDGQNEGKVAGASMGLAGTMIKDVAKTVADSARSAITINKNYKTAKNTTDAKYADLANSASNIHNSGKISGNSMLVKSAIGRGSKYVYDMKWFINEIVDVEKYQIAFDFNRYGYTCDWISDNRNLNDFLSRRLWDYVEIINAGELLRNVNIDPVILSTIAECFKSGITIFRAETHSEPIKIDYTQHNYELSLLDGFRLDYVFDTLLL